MKMSCKQNQQPNQSIMKKILIVLFAAFGWWGHSFGQVQELAGDYHQCSASCFFESCQISCYVSGNVTAARCNCSWGFAYCTCISIRYRSEHTISQNAQQRAALLAYQADLAESGQGELAELVGEIQTKIEQKEAGSANKLVGQYIAKIETLPQTAKTSVQESLDRHLGN